MDIYVLDKTFTSIAIIDSVESIIWTDRYCGFGDFEIYTPINLEMLEYTKQDYYLWSSESEHVMIIDEIVITTDIEAGNICIVRGRSLEWILERRIIWVQTILRGNFQSAIQRLLNENIISPSISARKIANFIFQPSTDPRITSLTIDTQFTGTNLFTAIKELCESKNIGFKIILSDKNQFVFSLYMGEDRSYAQTINPYVIFSPSFENIINSNYLETSRVQRTAALIAGEGEGIDRKTATIGGGSDLARREIFFDARDISSNTQEGDLTPAQYTAALVARGNQRMTEYIFIKTFEGDVETTQMFVFRKDFFLGDIIQITNEWGIEASARIGEVIFSQNKSGNNTVPTFSVIS